jgi:hypothetical protein
VPTTERPPGLPAARAAEATALALAQAGVPASSALTRQWLGRQPYGPSRLADIDRPEYVTA